MTRDRVSLKQKLGCWLHERRQTELVLRGLSKQDWRTLCNRNEELLQGADNAQIPTWQFSSALTVSRFFPDVGGRLLAHCFEDNAVRWGTAFECADQPRISVILPVGGLGRLDLFQSCLAGLLGQTNVALEICVVEHAAEPEFEAFVPDAVRYIFVQNDDPHGRYNKSLAMNRGVAAATADHVLLLDADLMLPANACAEMLERVRGFDALRPVRWAFFLSQSSSRAYIQSRGRKLPEQVSYIQQHNPGLATLVTREAYWRVGGHDEQFLGWGGEDVEFLDRLKTQRIYPGSYLPVIHLWHAAAPQKASKQSNLDQQQRLAAIPVSERISALREKQGAALPNSAEASETGQ